MAEDTEKIDYISHFTDNTHFGVQVERGRESSNYTALCSYSCRVMINALLHNIYYYYYRCMCSYKSQSHDPAYKLLQEEV